MLLEFFIKVVDANGKYLRTVNVYACDFQMACSMLINSDLLAENEFIGHN